MNFETFDKFQAGLLAEVTKMRDTKGKEYAHDQDRFANFRRLAEQLGIPDYQVGWVYAVKHIDSIASYMKTGQTFSSEQIRGRFVDLITYLTLIAGMVLEASHWNANQGTHEVKQRIIEPLEQTDHNIKKHQPFEYDNPGRDT